MDSIAAATGWPNSPTRATSEASPPASGAAVVTATGAPASFMACTSRRVLLRSNPTCNMRTGPPSVAPAGSHRKRDPGEAPAFMAFRDRYAGGRRALGRMLGGEKRRPRLISTRRRGVLMTTQPDDTQPTIVLVHGAWADATGFEPEIRALQERGFRAVGFGNPLRDLRSDATYLAEFLRTLTGPI